MRNYRITAADNPQHDGAVDLADGPVLIGPHYLRVVVREDGLDIADDAQVPDVRLWVDDNELDPGGDASVSLMDDEDRRSYGCTIAFDSPIDLTGEHVIAAKDSDGEMVTGRTSVYVEPEPEHSPVGHVLIAAGASANLVAIADRLEVQGGLSEDDAQSLLTGIGALDVTTMAVADLQRIAGLAAIARQIIDARDRVLAELRESLSD